MIKIGERKLSDEAKRKISESRKKYVMEKHPSWKGGRRINHNGYVQVRMKNHHRSVNGYVFEHILVAENKIGRRIKPNEHVHHINHVKTDNREENLMVLDCAEHARIHAPKKQGKYVSCVVCGKEVYRKLSHVKERNCCSLECVGKLSNLGNITRKVTDEQIKESMKKHNGKIKLVAEELGVWKTTIYNRLKRMGER